MTNIRGTVVILNGVSVPASGYKPISGSGYIYEVLRLIDGKYLFLDDHLERLIKSCNSTRLACPEKTQLIKSLKALYQLSSIDNGNIKLTLGHFRKDIRTACYFIPHFYPTKEEYYNGVHIKSYSYLRPDPNIKKWNDSFRKDIRTFIERENIYEAVLINKENKLTEGSRSNIFYIDKKGHIISAPEKYVLPGITRKYILKICQNLDMQIEERLLDLQEIGEMQACFLSGTSPMVLPVHQLDEYIFDVQNSIIAKIKERYLQLALGK